MERLEISRPDDWHVHLRDGAMLARVLPHTARRFRRAIVMPNLDPPVLTTADAEAYAARIRRCLPADSDFEPLMTLYLSDETTPAEIERASRSACVAAVKLYPKGATTHSARGVTGVDALGSVLDALERFDLPLLVHGESIAPDCDVFDREQAFLERSLIPLVERHAGLRVVFEHITTAVAAEWVSSAPPRIAATITPQHLLLNRNALFQGGLRPHQYCLPVLKREADRLALVRAATSGSPHFFLGSDSAPHVRSDKESACGCAGVFSAPVALEAYAEAFARAGALDRLEGFASHFGADFHRRPRNAGQVVLERHAWAGPECLGDGADALVVFFAGERLSYRLVDGQV